MESPITYRVEGMTCNGCVRALGDALGRALPGLRFEIALAPGELRVDGPHDPALVRAAVEDAGFDLPS